MTFSSQWGQVECHMKEDEPRKFYFLKEKGNQHPEGRRWAPRERRRMGVLSCGLKLRKIERCTMCCLKNDDIPISYSSRGVQGEGDIETWYWRPEIWCWNGSPIGSWSSSTQQIDIQLLSYSRMSYEIKIDKLLSMFHKKVALKSQHSFIECE